MDNGGLVSMLSFRKNTSTPCGKRIDLVIRAVSSCVQKTSAAGEMLQNR